VGLSLFKPCGNAEDIQVTNLTNPLSIMLPFSGGQGDRRRLTCERGIYKEVDVLCRSVAHTVNCKSCLT
jgi:methylaspartate ammonia-lyase